MASKIFTYNYFIQENVCRLCWTTYHGEELSYDLNSLEEDVTLAEKIKECVGVDVTTYNHLKYICSKCLNQIDIWWKFKKFCQDKDKKLSDILQNAEKQLQSSLISKEDDIDKFLKMETELQLKIEALDMKKERFEMDILNFNSISEENLLVFDENLSDYDTESSDFIISHLNINKNRSPTPPLTIESCQTIQFNLKKELIENNLKNGNKHEAIKSFPCTKELNNCQLRLEHEDKSCTNLNKSYKCQVCNIYLHKYNLYIQHMRLHREKKTRIPDLNRCKKCLKSFDNLKSLRDHIHTQCKSIHTCVCEICGRVFKNKSNLSIHKMTHEKVKPLKCPHCTYRAVQPSSLTIHIRTHTGERPYACGLCPLRCINSSNLIKHRKLHFGIKEFECDICQKRFCRKEEVNEHITIVHKNFKKHKCPQCGTDYARFRTLRGHLLLKHGLKVKKMKGELIEVASGINYKRRKKTDKVS